MTPDATKSMATWIVVGTAIGDGIGTAMDDLALGVGIDIAFGAAMGSFGSRHRDERNHEPGADRG